MKILSYNVNGIRAVINKGFYEWLEHENPDVICLQETKAQPEQIDILKFKELGYDSYINSAQKKGYSGTVIFTKIQPLSIECNFGNHFENTIFIDEYGDVLREGRIIAMEFPDFFLLTTYVPNAKPDLSRLTLRHDVWDKKLLEYIATLERKKPVLLCGDLNVAHNEIDLANPKQNTKNAGFTSEEREGFDNFMTHGLVDIFRNQNPTKVQYTWWSMRSRAREKNIGWRIDYFLCSHSFLSRIQSIEILDTVAMSDHCPVQLTINNE
ncbi:MAG: exodeoxyribonuclease III [Bacteroidales bacterium]|jgi:exodeoxyribonuclease-3|nr:exodeoxyribonuclease III [Bacteroidales bacterium]